MCSCAPAEELRERLLAQTGDAALVSRLAPRQPGEADAARRGRALYGRLQQSLGLDAQQRAALQVGPVAGMLYMVAWAGNNETWALKGWRGFSTSGLACCCV